MTSNTARVRGTEMTAPRSNTAEPHHSVSKRQIEALRAAIEKGGAWFLRGTNMGGAKRRMIERLIADGLLTDCPPYPATDAGRARYAELMEGCV